MSDYTLTTRNDAATITLDETTYTLTVDGNSYTAEIANIGAQGPSGVSVTSAAIVNDEVVFYLSNGGNINLGNMRTIFNLKLLASTAELDDVEGGTLSNGLIQGGNF